MKFTPGEARQAMKKRAEAEASMNNAAPRGRIDELGQ